MPHQLSSAVRAPALANRLNPFSGFGTLLPTSLENVTDRLPLELMAPPLIFAVLPDKELVVTLSGPLSTIIAPPLPADAVLFEKVELLTV
jgi:hypothetical protein